MMVTVPETTHEKITGLLKLLKISGQPYHVTVASDSWALPNECFDNVAEKIQRDGGERIVGWQLWEHPFIIEAEYHAIWKSPEGELVDISPKNIPTGHILFIEDPSRPYENRQLDNIRLNKTNNLLVDDFIALASAKFEVFSGGDRAFEKLVHLSPNDQEVLRYIEGMMTAIHAMIGKGGVRNTACFCASGLKYKHCHGKGLIPYLKTIGT